MALPLLSGSPALAQTETSAAQPTPPLFETIPWAIDSLPKGNVVTGDFDGDGVVELAYRRNVSAFSLYTTAYQNASDSILIRHANGDLTFTTVEEIPLDLPNYYSTRLIATDLDGDGRDDLLAALGESFSSIEFEFGWYRYSEFGWEWLPIERNGFVIEVNPLSCRLNDDGYTDLVTYKGTKVYVSPGSSSGPGGLIEATWPEITGAPAPFDRASLNKLLDLDGDGLDDLVLWLYDSAIGDRVGFAAVFASGEPGVFVEPTMLSGDPTLRNLEHINPADPGFEHRLYLQAEEESPTQWEVPLPITRGVTPTLIERQFAYANVLDNERQLRPSSSYRPTYADLDSNGTLDRIGVKPLVFNFFSDDEIAFPTYQSHPRDVVLLDVNNDGYRDLIGSTGATLAVSRPGQPVAFSTNGYVSDPSSIQILLTDIDADGDQDLLMKNGFANPGVPDVEWTELPDLSPSLMSNSFMVSNAAHPAYVRPVLVWVQSAPGISTLYLDPPIDPANPTEPLVVATGGLEQTPVIPADLDGDGWDEIAWIRKDEDTGQQTLEVYAVNGSTYAPSQSFAFENPMLGLVSGDFNHDGHADLAVGEFEPGPNGTFEVYFCFNDGEGALQTPVALTVGIRGYWLHAADLDNDGRTDLLIGDDRGSSSTLNDPRLIAWMQPEEGGPETASLIPIGQGIVGAASEIRTADFDRDGSLDIYAAGRGGISSSNSILITNPLVPEASGYWVLGTSSSFGEPAAAVGDLNGDGRPDLAQMTPVGATLRMSLGRVAGACPADINNDGIADFGDIQAFIQLFLVQDPAADSNGDGVVDFGDIQTFVAAFLAGC